MNTRNILRMPSPLLWTVLVASIVCGWIAYARNWQTALLLFIVAVGIAATKDIRARRQPRSIVRRRGASSVRPVVSPHNSEHAPRRCTTIPTAGHVDEIVFCDGSVLKFVHSDECIEPFVGSDDPIVIEPITITIDPCEPKTKKAE